MEAQSGLPESRSASAPLSISTADPDDFTERIHAVSPGVSMTATARRGFRARVRAWRLGGCGFLSLRIDHGLVRFPRACGYGGVTVPLYSGFEGTVQGRRVEFGAGRAHSLGTQGGEIETLPGSHMLGVNVEQVLLDAHWEAHDARFGAGGECADRVVRTGTPAGRRLMAYLDDVWRELVRPDSPAHAPLVAQEIEDTVAGLLVEAVAGPEANGAAAPGNDTARRAEEILAARLERPVALAEVARSLGVSTRTLSRAFLERHGMGPIAFLRRRRLEAARRDLIDADPEDASVTGVALRYGFNHLGRFSVAYHRLFGEPPSETLHIR
jgi:AraC-like DNA-binding protein